MTLFNASWLTIDIKIKHKYILKNKIKIGYISDIKIYLMLNYFIIKMPLILNNFS